MRTEDGVANSVVLSVDVKEFVMVVDRSGEGGGWCKQTDEAEAERWRHDELGWGPRLFKTRAGGSLLIPINQFT
ncbi:hypothetical protein IGI04_034651 [Brassica rapa subsp. trilocularis]|uniref:Uncharacterized protein n=1 Tax=Brassica rapa subsp. trilocularis TaxID=1813537 RepID=A0ABQ7KHF8_BRACM|nr:hypothetical protein IGI04_042816 [Brassica rapa subsp. trilocularis]KAG5383181.1 hypothetical protein IGI04_034651 [Brassica rapa subsp. trilocularis]